LAERPAVLVLGAAGFFGLAIVRALTAHGVRVIASDRVDPDEFVVRPGTQTELVHYERRDVTVDSLDDLAAAAGGAVHAAALTPQDEAAGDTADRLLRVNLESLLSLLRAANASGSCRRVLFVSSAGVYDQRREESLTEADADGGTSLYGAAKLAGEIIGRRYASVVGLDFGAVRPTSLYGAGEIIRASRPRVTAFAQLIDAARRGEPVRLLHPDARTDWLCVDDAADAIALLWEHERFDGTIFNLSSAHPRRFADVAEEVAAATDLQLTETATRGVDGGGDRPALIDNRLIRETLDWRPRRTLRDEARALAQQQDSVSASGGVR
jgi:nucleoside-diphosphate-sugar epimerase